MRDKQRIDGLHAASDHDRLFGEGLQRDCPGAKFLRAAELPLQRVAHEDDALANHPTADWFGETLAGPPRRVRSGNVPSHFGRAADRFADLIAAVDQPLVHAA